MNQLLYNNRYWNYRIKEYWNICYFSSRFIESGHWLSNQMIGSATFKTSLGEMSDITKKLVNVPPNFLSTEVEVPKIIYQATWEKINFNPMMKCTKNGILLPKLLWSTVKTNVLVMEKTFEFRAWRPRIFKIFEITRTIY